MDVTLICTMFEELPRQGPGADESTAHACSFIPSDFKQGKILVSGADQVCRLLPLPGSVLIP